MFYPKWTFSLTSLVLMLSLCFIASSAMAQFEITLNVGANDGADGTAGNDDDNLGDLSFADGNQIRYGAATTIKIMSAKVVNFHATATAATAALAADDTGHASSGTAVGADDFTIIAYNKFGGVVTDGAPVLGVVEVDGTPDGKHFMALLGSVTVPGTPTVSNTITRVLIVLPKEKVELADPRAELAADGTRNAAGKNKETSIELHYVGATEGTAIGTVTGGTFTASTVAGDVVDR